MLCFGHRARREEAAQLAPWCTKAAKEEKNGVTLPRRMWHSAARTKTRLARQGAIETTLRNPFGRQLCACRYLSFFRPGPYYKPTSSQIPLNLLHRCIVLSRPGHHKKRLLNLSKVREGGKARYN
ncbi:hypothetical protein SLEP1_g59597 [Rubroshorea leprosula]|uniref:Uncharacterized protein n=1 Tax=Rubroshorea leprosula TaxID=152421 RepID=A0AAV5MW08_9ROSI|nr:hypothetical protein SLEP1_g59597 [Rubroshorea leprosula]